MFVCKAGVYKGARLTMPLPQATVRSFVLEGACANNVLITIVSTHLLSHWDISKMLLLSKHVAIIPRGGDLWNPPDGQTPATSQDPKRLGVGEDDHRIRWYEIVVIVFCCLAFVAFIAGVFWLRGRRGQKDDEEASDNDGQGEDGVSATVSQPRKTNQEASAVSEHGGGSRPLANTMIRNATTRSLDS
jgi:hypothetical protein